MFIGWQLHKLCFFCHCSSPGKAASSLRHFLVVFIYIFEVLVDVVAARSVWIRDQEKALEKKVRGKSRECHNHKPQPFPDIKWKRPPPNPNKHKSIKRTKITKISSLFPKRGNRNAKRTEKHKNKMAQGKTYNKSPRRIKPQSTKE